MSIRNHIRISGIIIISLLIYSCQSPVPLPGDIEGKVTDAANSEPVDKALIRLMQDNVINDSTRTVIDGTYHLKNIPEEYYEIKASKNGYSTEMVPVNVQSTITKEINFHLNKIPIINISTNLLDFGLDSTTIQFYISKSGPGVLAYALSKSPNWITLSPSLGEMTEETEIDSITVTIDRSKMGTGKYKERIIVSQLTGQDESQDFYIIVYVNGFWIESKYVNLVRIGTQIWMGENVNAGTRINSSEDQTDNNGKIEKYCYNDMDFYCETYGGLYQWREMMQYNPSDTGDIGTTQGICPEGWHLPTGKEWAKLIEYLGGDSIAGGKMKETGTGHWLSPNTCATNESGFTALPGGIFDLLWENIPRGFWNVGEIGYWWPANIHVPTDIVTYFFLDRNSCEITYWGGGVNWNCAASVRCVKDP